MKGYINKTNLDLYINNVFVVGKNNKIIEVETLLDTGFNGFFCLPYSIIQECEFEKKGYVSTELGDGSQIDEPFFRGEIIIENQSFFGEIVATIADQALIGNEILLNKVVTLNFKEFIIKVED